MSALAWANDRRDVPPRGVPSLEDLSLAALAAQPDAIVNLQCMPENLVLGLLYRIMSQGRLNYRLAILFRDAGHEKITEAIQSLDLLAGIPTHNTITKRSNGAGPMR